MIATIRSTAAVLFSIVLTPLAALIGFPWTWITGSADRLYAMALWIAGSALRIAGVRVQVDGREHLDPAQSYIFMCNHVSNLDPPILIRAIPCRSSVLVKKELFRIPVLGAAMRMGSLVPVDRHNREAAVSSIQKAEEVLRMGINMMIFPEGTRSPDGRLLPFKKGPFYLAIDTGIAIVPVTVLGSEKLMPKGSAVIQPGSVRLLFHPPVRPAEFGDRDQLIAAVRERIASALPLDLREANMDATS